MAKSTQNTSDKVDKDRIDEILAEVTGELHEMLKSEQATLAKGARDGEPDEESSGSSDGVPVQDLATDQEESTPVEETAAPEATEESAPTLEQLVDAYSQLSPEELDMHLQAATMAAQAQAPEQGDPDGGAAMDAAQAAPAPAPEPAAKSEPNPEIELLKQQIELQKRENDLRKEELALRDKAISELVDALHATPLRKSITRISDLNVQGKPDGGTAKDAPDFSQMKKSEVVARLRTKARDASLKKNDRDLINSYCAGMVSLDKISHLLGA